MPVVASEHGQPGEEEMKNYVCVYIYLKPAPSQIIIYPSRVL